MGFKLAVRICVTIMLVAFSLSLSPRGEQLRSNKTPPPVPVVTPSTTQRFYALVPATGWADGELVLNNNSPEPIAVTPTFFRNAISEPLTPIVLQPAEVKWLRLNDFALQHSVRGVDSEGLELEYLGHMLTVGAQLTLFEQQSGGVVDIPFSSAMDYKSSVQEAVWSSVPGANAVIALANCSDVSVSVSIDSAALKDVVDLAPHATRTFSIPARGNTVSVASVHLEERGPLGAVRASGFVEGHGRVLSDIRFYDPASAHQSNLYASNLTVSGRHPVLVLKNTSDINITAVPRFLPFDDGEPYTLPAVNLGPHVATSVDLGPLVRASASRFDLDSVSVRVDNSGPPGSLIGELSGLSADGAIVSDVPLRDSGTPRQSTGSYPWRLDDDFDSVISVTNVSDTSAEFIARIAYAGGVYEFKIQQLASGRTRTFNMRKMRDEHVLDVHGRALPASVMSGQFRWGMIRGGTESKLNGREDIISGRAQRSTSYSCSVCCPPSFANAWIDPYSWDVPIDAGSSADMYVGFVDCDGGWLGEYTIGPEYYDYYDSGVVSLWTDGSAQAWGVDGGETFPYANASGFDVYTPSNDEADICIDSTADPFAQADTKVRKPTYVQTVDALYTLGPPAPWLYSTNRQILDQDHAGMDDVPSMFVDETYSPDPPSAGSGGACTTGYVDAGNGSANYSYFPDNYSMDSAPSNHDCTNNSTQSYGVTLNGTRYAILTTYGVTWSYNGVTLVPNEP